MLESFLHLRKFFDCPELWGVGIYSRQDAKNAKLKEIFLAAFASLRETIRLSVVALPRWVHEVKDKTVVVEFNHSLAGETLNFDVKVTDIQAVEA